MADARWFSFLRSCKASKSGSSRFLRPSKTPKLSHIALQFLLRVLMVRVLRRRYVLALLVVMSLSGTSSRSSSLSTGDGVVFERIGRLIGLLHVVNLPALGRELLWTLSDSSLVALAFSQSPNIVLLGWLPPDDGSLIPCKLTAGPLSGFRVRHGSEFDPFLGLELPLP